MWITTIWERVRSTLFGKNAFEKSRIGTTIITDDMATAINRWAELYTNRAPWLTKNPASMGLPSSIAREISTMVTLEMQVNVADPALADNPNGNETEQEMTRAAFIKKVFENIMPQMQTQTEYACALGGLVFKPYVSNNAVAVDFVQADDFYPVTFNSRGEIRSAIFLERKRTGDKFFTRVEKHEILPNDYLVTNKAYQSHADNDIGTEISMASIPEWADIEPEVHIDNVDYPLFAYFKVPLGNVVDKHSQLGVSVYARADRAHLIEEADKQWQRFLWEFEGGEMAVDASAEAFKNKRLIGGDGKAEIIPVLPSGKERLFRMNSLTTSNTGELMKTFAPALRDSSYAAGINNILMRIEDMCGLARGTYSDVNETVRTATELKISRQRSYSTVTAIQRSLERALNTLAKAVDTFATLYNLAPAGEYTMSYVWDDSIVVDADVEREKDRTDVRDGLMLPWEYRVKWYGETKEQAQKVLGESEGPSDDEIMDFQKRLQEPEINE